MGHCGHLTIFPGGRSTLSTVVEILRVNCFQFQMAAVRHSGFQKVGHLKLTVYPVRRANMHHQAKFSADRSNHCSVMAVFQLFKMAASAILDF